VELLFDGLSMGAFEGGIAYTIYPGSRLIQQEAVVTTNQPDVAYYYDAGWEMGARADRTVGGNMGTNVAYYDTSGELAHVVTTGFEPERVPAEVRYRTLAVGTSGGISTSFPATSRLTSVISGTAPGAGVSRWASVRSAIRTGSSTPG
jgi:hypothetical protein